MDERVFIPESRGHARVQTRLGRVSPQLLLAARRVEYELEYRLVSAPCSWVHHAAPPLPS